MQVPVMLPGGTDCRYYRGLGGAVAYGANLLEPSLTFGWVLSCLDCFHLRSSCALVSAYRILSVQTWLTFFFLFRLFFLVAVAV